LPRVLQPIVQNKADLVLGNRDLRRAPDALPIHARLGNLLVRRLVALLTGRRYGDLPSCKAITSSCFRGLHMQEMTYGWTVEMLVKSARLGLRTEEVWITYRARLGGQSKVAGSVRGSLGAATKLVSCAIAYARWSGR
jgi:hypothetical protein